jgi:peptidoglycan LD-endopeptidase CwlK
MTLNARSLKNLQGVHPDLVRVVKLASEKADFLVTEGLRTIERQKMLKAGGKSKTLNSRHLTGHAVDLCDCDGCYDKPDLTKIAAAMKDAAEELGVDIEWGGDWKGAWDMPHFQLPWKNYPESGLTVTTKVVEAAKTKPAVAAATGGAALALPSLPAVPDLAPWTAWQGFGEQVSGLLSWGYQNPMITGCLALWLGASYFLPSIVERFTWSRS